MMKTMIAAIGAVMALLLMLPIMVTAQGSTGTINFQGELADSGGNLLNGSYNMRFAVYDASSGGNRVWPTTVSHEQHNDVPIGDGLFNVLLGSEGQPLSATNFDGGNRYLQVWVCRSAGAGCTSYESLVPRQPMASVAYALTAATLLSPARISSDSGYGLSVETSHSGDYTTAIYGRATSTSGKTVGVLGSTESQDDDTVGVWGQAGKGDGVGYGVLGQTGSSNSESAGVKGTAGSGYGVLGETSGTDNDAAAGYFEAKGASGRTYGVYGKTDSSSANASGVYGFSTQGATNGVWGETTSSADSASGVYGLASAGSGHTYGVYGRNTSTAGTGVYGEAAATTGKTHGVHGVTQSTGEEAAGVYGLAAKPVGKTYGVRGATNSSTDDASGVFGQAYAESGQVYGVQGWTTSDADGAAGVHGRSVAADGEGAGVYGKSASPDGYGGYFENTTRGSWPQLSIGVYGKSEHGYGVYSEGNAHVEGYLGVADGGAMPYLALHGVDDLPRGGFGGARALDIELSGSEYITSAVRIYNDLDGSGLRSIIWATEDRCPEDPDTGAPGVCQPLAAVHGLSLGTIGIPGVFGNTYDSRAPSLWIDNFSDNYAAVIGSVAGNGKGLDISAARLGLSVSASADGPAAPEDHIAVIHNASDGDSADVLALQVSRVHSAESPIGPEQNFITFLEGDDTSLGAIQGNGSGGVVLAGPGSDFAEWLPRLRASEVVEPGDIVGVFDGRITKATEGAHHVMVVSTAPIVAGKRASDEARHLGERVAFVGQVPVKVKGAVRAGEFIVPSGLNDGTGVAVSPDRLTSVQLDQIVGVAWEASDHKELKLINTVVGLQFSGRALRQLSLERDQQIQRLTHELREKAQQIEKLQSQVDALLESMADLEARMAARD